MTKGRLVVAIDGPAGAGKSTIARNVSKILDLEYIDTGAMYRALTLKVIKNQVDIQDKDDVLKLVQSTSIKFKNNKIYLDGVAVDKEIRRNIVSNNVSNVAKIKEVREQLVAMQRELAKDSSIIMDGRDIGTVVLPDADFKFFIVASIEERARRRYIELVNKGEKDISYEKVLNEIKRRDTIDSTRDIAPLKKAPDAYEIDTSNQTIEESTKEVIKVIEGR